MIEKALKLLIVSSNIFLILAFLCSIFQGVVARGLGLSSPESLMVFVSSIAVLLSCFSDTCILFYFIGTGVWIKDRAKERFQNERKLALELWQYFEAANKLKAKTFPFATFGLGFAVFTFILTGAYQVGAIGAAALISLASLWILNEWLGMRFHLQQIRNNIQILDKVTTLIQ